MKIEISKIIVEKRIRKDLGDIPELAENIQCEGLFCPIIVRKINDTQFKLLDGQRRLEAHKLLQLTSIEVIIRK